MSSLDLLIALGLVIVVVAMRELGVMISLGHSLIANESGGNTPVREQREGDDPENHRCDFADQNSKKWFQASSQAWKNPDCTRSVDDCPNSLIILE